MSPLATLVIFVALMGPLFGAERTGEHRDGAMRA